MSMTLKDCLDPWKAADLGLSVTGQLDLQALPRLSALLLNNPDGEPGVVEASLVFARDEDRRPFVEGNLSCQLTMQCQRCLEPMTLTVDEPLSMVFIEAGSRVEMTDNQEPESRDIYDVEDRRLCLLDVIEDELLLQMPQVPMHTAPACVINTEFGDEPAAAETGEKENPFAVLAGLKGKLNS